MKDSNDSKKESRKSISQYIDDWIKVKPSPSPDGKEKEKKKEIGPAKMDVTQWLGDAVKSWVILHPDRGEY